MPGSAAPEWEDPRRVLRRHGLAPKRGFSQNFLVARSVVERIADAVEAAGGEPVVELGPGLGTLTTALLRRGARVLALERDRDMIAVLRSELADVDGFEVRQEDAAAVDFGSLAQELGKKPAVAGNLPYAITGAILRNLVLHRTHVSRAVVMVQREVRDRLLAQPGTKAWGALTVFTSAAFDVSPVVKVPPGAFHPPPRVSSAVVKLVPREEPRAEETPTFRAVVRGIFDARRKTLRNALLGAGIGATEVDTALAAAAIDGRRRGETLEIEELAALAAAVTATRT